ncbi:ABC transporter permease/substrate-binding protein [Enterococcus timonensis]|uniref:ABC transporter permease/substrate-binding protein n=1 Tax=Enterococcus timonensis TaxID=1852364 RepID=UPI0008DB0560|nr:ABC transporter permease/substrate-binding protein [Enterococcus timonensis]
MNTFWTTLVERREELLAALLQHLIISLTALLIACLIAIPLGIILAPHKKGAEIILQITSVLQTIPSLALLGLLIPIVGIGTTPALIALIIYALLPIFQNTYLGLSGIQPSIEEAATAFGMSKWRKLWKVEIPIALPVIISGIRTALVLIIGTATLAALIGAGGLGTFILLGIDRNTPQLTIIGAISSALLAITFSFLIRFLQNRRPRVTVAVLLIFLLGIGGLTWAQNRPGATEEIVIAGKLGAEPTILTAMYQQLIEENSDVKVTVKENFGKTSFLFSALENDQIDIYPEFTGTVLASLVKNDQDPASLSPEETATLATDLLQEQFSMTLLPPMAYENTYTVAVTRAFAQEHGLENISDLLPIQNEIRAGFTLEFIDRTDGYAGMQTLYGLEFSSVQSMEPSLRYQALMNDDVDIIDGYSTDSQIKEYDLITLTDDLQLFPSYRGAPLMKTSFAKTHPEIVEALNKLAGKITEDEMVTMNYAVNVEKKTPQEVAKDYLQQHDLLEVD